MADELSALFNKASISDNERIMYENELYAAGYSSEQVKYIIDTAHYLLDTYPGKYRKILKAINEVITKMKETYQRGGQWKHTKSRKVSKNTKSNKQHRSSKRKTRRTIKK